MQLQLTSTKTTPAACAAAAMMLAAATGASLANTYGTFTNNNDFLWGVSGMPDFDQKRAAIFAVEGLPNDGSMYCVPTSTMNVLAYISKHGYAGIDPGIHDWDGGSAAVYDIATANILELGSGSFMGTSATGGTSAESWYDGVTTWLDPNDFDVYQRLAVEGQPTTSRHIAEYGHMGALTVFCYGRWEHQNGSTLLDRVSGHCVTTTRVQKIPPFVNTVSYRDPGSSDSLFFQSDFATTTQNLSDQVFSYNGGTYTMSKMVLNPVPEDGRHRLLDKIYAIYPKQGLTNIPPGGISTLTPGAFTNGLPQVQPLNVPGGAVLDCETAPSRTFGAYFTAGSEVMPPGLYIVDLVTGGALRADDLNDPHGLVFGRDETLYVLDGRQIKRYVAEPTSASGSTCRNNLRQLGLAAHNFNDARALTFDDANDKVLVLANNPPALVVFDADLPSTPPQVSLLPTMLATKTWDILAVEPASPYRGGAGLDILIGNTGGDRLYKLAPDATGGYIIGAMWNAPVEHTIEDIAWADPGRGHVVLFTPDGQRLVVSIKGLDGANIGPDPDSPFNNMEAGSRFQISRSRSNYVARIHGTRGWNTNIAAEDLDVFPETRDCLADWNVDQTVDVFDLLAYLAEWFEHDADADLNDDTVIDVFDLLAFLERWFRGC